MRTASPRTLALALPLFIAACADDSSLDADDQLEGRYAMLELHDGYWVAEVPVDGLPVPVESIQDTHVDLQTRRVTVYAQSRLMGEITAPVQVGPSECATARSGETACYHPNAVYLNGTGREYVTDVGGGSWWVKHSWIVDGEGYHNCPFSLEESYTCNWATGTLMEDDVTLFMGSERNPGLYNIRGPVLDADPITYELVRYAPENFDPETGESSGEPTPVFVLDMNCTDAISEFDGVARGCP
ncbi:MAG: hypothetical protein AAF411_21740 [Myxococcota bacterium]